MKIKDDISVEMPDVCFPLVGSLPHLSELVFLINMDDGCNKVGVWCFETKQEKYERWKGKPLNSSTPRDQITIKSLNHFLVCSGCDKIISLHAQHRFTFKTVNIFLLAEHTQKFVWRMLSVRWNCFPICSACSCYNFRIYSKIPN